MSNKLVDRIGAILMAEEQAKDSEPDWIPAEFKRRQANALRTLAADGVDPSFIQAAVCAWRKRPDRVKAPGVVVDSIAFFERIDLLAFIEEAKARGPVEGSKMLLGDSLNKRQQAIAKGKRRPRRDALQRAVDCIVAASPAVTPEQLARELEGYPLNDEPCMVDDDEIMWTDDKGQQRKALRANLSGMIYKAKNRRKTS